MSGIALTAPVSRASDPGVDVLFIGINYDTSKVIVRLRYTPSGTERDFTFEGNALAAMRSAVSNFSGLRVALLQYIQTLTGDLGGNVT